MSESNIISKKFKKINVYLYNYLKNKNIKQLASYRDKVGEFKKKNYICFINIENLNNNLTNNFEIIIEEILISFNDIVETQFV